MQLAALLIALTSMVFSLYGLLVSGLYMRASKQYRKATEAIIARDSFMHEIHRRMGNEYRRTAERWDFGHRLGFWS